MITQQEKIIKAIQKINPSAEVTLNSDNLDEITWIEGTSPIPVSDIEAQIPVVETEIENEAQAKIDLKASAKAKLIAGEALTEDEADTIVL